MPLGLNRLALGQTPEARFSELMRRSRLFWKDSLLHSRSPADIETFRQVGLSSVSALSKIRLDFTNGADQDITAALRRIADSMPVTVYASDRDPLFPYREVAPGLAGSAIKLVKLDTPHLNRASPLGLKQLQGVTDNLTRLT